MMTEIYCKQMVRGTHSFYLSTDEGDFFLFQQSFRRSVRDYFEGGVRLDKALDHSRANRDVNVIRTISKLPMYIRYVEKEYGITVLEQTKRKKERKHFNEELWCA